MDSNEIYKLYLRDLVFLIKEKVNENVKSTDAFDIGNHHGIESILRLIEDQAVAFNIDLNEFGFYDFEKYRDRKVE